jgi:uncharacterized protein YjiS (DUF1127 family)
MQVPGPFFSHQHEEIVMSFHSLTSTWSPAIPATRAPLVLRLFEALRYEIRMRRAIRQVNSLDERTLIDIGMLPGSTEHAVRRGRGR